MESRYQRWMYNYDISSGSEAIKKLFLWYGGNERWETGSNSARSRRTDDSKYMSDCLCPNREGNRALTVKTMKKYDWREGGRGVSEIRMNFGNLSNFVISTVAVPMDCQFRAKTD